MSDDATDTFDCFGSRCSVHVSGEGPLGSAQEAVAAARAALLEWHQRFSRFIPDSELSRLNRNPHTRVETSSLMARLGACVRGAASLTGGLVDGTLLQALCSAGYTSDIAEPLPLTRALALAPPRRPAGPSPAARWRALEVDVSRPSITRPPGLAIDSGGIAKGLLADVLAERLEGHALYAVNCAGDVAIGGAPAAAPREIEVESPFDGTVLHSFGLTHGGVATSGIGRRAWLDPDGRPAHHLLDPASGLPAFTGIVQVTALAATALSAEVRAKAALLSGPRRAARWLPDGGVVVLDDGSHHILEPPPRVALEDLQQFARAGARHA
ncbi:MAG TPA: FAD:protein FMN transferase [Solirubrobacteraceae bacterium]|jgi:thiamine biosynthesis lipoprotein|nr:FAD:protein FMN transferase [Solirubrobacteraceae bacterium]